MNSKINRKPSLLYVGNKLSHYGFTLGVIETLGPLLEREGYIVSYAGTYKIQAIRFIEIILKVVFIGRKANYILIDTYSTSAFWFAYFAGMMARLIKVPYITLLHGGDLPRRLAKSKRACQRLFNHSYANVAVSGYLKHEFEERGINVTLIPNTINIKDYPFKLREKMRPRLLWVRSFHRQYNPNMAADVLKKLSRIYPEAELCMVGPDKDGSMEDFRNYVNELGMGEQIKITGLLKKEEWIKLAEDYDFFINTTNVDNTPISVIEAMALGLNVISTDPGGIPFLLNNDIDSVLVQRGDACAMATEIEKLIKNPAKVGALSKAARDKAEGFDYIHVLNQWCELLV
jgi:glycosyltransferase involved in cell wall biosynthesis